MNTIIGELGKPDINIGLNKRGYDRNNFSNKWIQ